MACVLVLGSSIAGCQAGGNAKASASAVPKVYTSSVFDHVTYPDGKPTGTHEDGPWVKTVRVYEAEMAWARAHYDWTSPQLTKIADQDTVSHWAWWQIFDTRDKKYSKLIPAGPFPLTILSVETNQYGTAVVTACRGNDWYIARDVLPPTITAAHGNYVEYTVDTAGNGYAQVVGESNFSKKQCDIDMAKPSYFNPLPKYIELTEGDIRLTDAIRSYLSNSSGGQK